MAECVILNFNQNSPDQTDGASTLSSTYLAEGVVRYVLTEIELALLVYFDYIGCLD